VGLRGKYRTLRNHVIRLRKKGFYLIVRGIEKRHEGLYADIRFAEFVHGRPKFTHSGVRLEMAQLDELIAALIDVKKTLEVEKSLEVEAATT